MPPKFTLLPTELLDAVASHLPILDLLALCRTNRGLYHICLRWIYRSVSPSTVACTVRVLKTLISNIPAAAHMRVLVIVIPLEGVLKSFKRLLSTALANLTSLESFNYASSPTLCAAFTHIRFPRLQDCLITLCPDAIIFLRLHPTLVRLGVVSDWPSDIAPYLGLSDLSLPALRDFSGPASTLPLILPNSPVEIMTISWDPNPHEAYPAVFAAIAAAREPSRIVHMHNFVYTTWDPALLLAIAEHLPHLTVLRVFYANIPGMPPDAGEIEAFYDILKITILDLPNLKTLSCTARGNPSPTTADLALEIRMLGEWGCRSALLRNCTLPSDTMWVRKADNFWYPYAPNMDPVESLWRLRWLVEAAVRTPAEYPGYAAQMEQVVGNPQWTEMVEALNAEAP
ncbi:hypothetical protein B0H16DRAFT_1703697 [Mycena metata]|uniref:F-box domain-containing protein n=1 Tax=Mycena metata TaxID=1033252 RepID=A0AAD7MCM3_9AGAR|nr:hypothetical protein B0H16DRAFT_1703697 [Mycena metata]